ncbi:MAG: SPOR domain-containing protein [Piscinibacter sp.]|nr:SPOR domain-containing protein [Piscinibacter sp.]
MGLLSIFQRRNSGADVPPRPTETGDAITAARTRARRRLMGAAVLVMAGVIGFPLVFETQPRPIPVDIPIEIPRKDGAPALPMPPARPAATKASAPLAVPREEAPPQVAVDVPRVAAAPASAAVTKPATPVVEPPKKAVAETRPPAAIPAPAPESARAKALLEGKESAKPAATAAKPDAGRFVVQVGAFADATAAREMRGKVERLGLKSYMQVVETSSGNRTRVRAGPFDSRDEAEKALAKAKAAGLNAVVLTL